MLVFDDCIVPIAKESLDFPMQVTIVPAKGNGSSTLTRSTADFVMDHEGLAVTVLAGEIREEGARRVENLWKTPSATLSSGSSYTMTLAAGIYDFSMGIGTGTATFSGTGGETGTLTASATNRKSVLKTITAGTLVVTASVATLIDLMVVNMTGVTNQNTPEYVNYGGDLAQTPVTKEKYCLHLTGVAGDFIQTPDSVENSITGDIDISCKLSMVDWTPAGYQTIISKLAGAGTRSYILQVAGGPGRLSFEISANGTATTGYVSTVAPTVTDGAILWVRVKRVSSTGAITFYTSADGTTWTQLGATVAGFTGALFDGTALLNIGAYNNGVTESLNGNIYSAQIYNGIRDAGGTLAVDFNVYRDATSSTGTITSSTTGEVWTLQNTARIVNIFYHGAGADGVKYFSTLNGNTVTSNVVTFATGAAIPDNELKGVLIEGTRTNLSTQSTDLSAGYSVVGLVKTGNDSAFINGKVTMARLTESAGGTFHQIYKQVTSVAGLFVGSVYVKRGTNRFIALNMESTSKTTVVFDMETRTFTSTVTSTSTTYKYGYKYLPLFDIFRIWLTDTVISGTTYFVVLGCNAAVPTYDANKYPIYSGDTSVYFWIGGIQEEQGAFPSSFIPTTTTSVTTNADVFTHPNALNVSDTQGTILLKITPAYDTPLGTLAGYGKQFILDFDAGKGLYIENQLLSFTDGTNIATIAFVPLRGVTYNVAAKWSGAGMQLVLNGVASSIASFDGSINSTTNMTIGGKGSDSTFNWKGNIKKLKVFKKAIPNSRIINLQKTFLVDEAGTQLVDEAGTPLFYF